MARRTPVAVPVCVGSGEKVTGMVQLERAWRGSAHCGTLNDPVVLSVSEVTGTNRLFVIVTLRGAAENPPAVGGNATAVGAKVNGATL
jgi:hypothetical protein